MKLTNTHAAQSDDQGPNKWLVHALIFNMVIVAAIWTTVVHLYHGGNSVASFLLFFVFIATAGMSMKVWFYTWMMLFTMDALRGEDDPSFDQLSPALRRVPFELRWPTWMYKHYFRGIVVLGLFLAMLLIVAYKVWLALGLVVLMGTAVLGYIELFRQRLAGK